jgi:polyisoprenoid-binding protein YceI
VGDGAANCFGHPGQSFVKEHHHAYVNGNRGSHLSDRPDAFGIDAKSINTDQADRDAHLRSADFFDVDRFPTLAFASTDVTRTGERTFDVTGTLTLHGVERRLTLPVSYLGRAKDPWGHERAAFEAEIVLNRKDFGLTWNAALETGGFMVGDEVRVSLSVQAIAQAE